MKMVTKEQVDEALDAMDAAWDSFDTELDAWDNVKDSMGTWGSQDALDAWAIWDAADTARGIWFAAYGKYHKLKKEYENDNAIC